jgi:tetratricopeptide (TPR) repeat protein
MTQDIIDKDHAFWSQYSARTVGNWITYDTSISNICAFCEKTYLRHDYSGFTGDRKFMRDDDAQKAFSKLRSSIGSSIYWWRATHPANQAEAQRTMKEAEFALKQAFAYCPYSPEAVFHLMQLLLDPRHTRVDDAIAVLKTCHALDPYNPQITDWISNLEGSKKRGEGGGGNVTVQQFLEQVGQQLAAKNTNAANQMLEQVLRLPQVDGATLIRVADLYLKSGNLPKSEEAIVRLTQVAPNSYEAWYNLAVIQGALGKTSDAVQDLQKAATLNDADRAQNPNAPNIRDHIINDPNLAFLRQTAEFKTAFATNH